MGRRSSLRLANLAFAALPFAALAGGAAAQSAASAPASQPGTRPAPPESVLDLTRMPTGWRPGAVAPMRARLSQEPWSAADAADAERAVERGLDEMVAFFRNRPRRVTRLGDNAVECFLDVAYGAMPALRDRARAQATAMLERCAAPWLARAPDRIRADDFQSLLTLAIYAHQLLPADSVVTQDLVARCNRAHAAAGSLARAVDFEFARAISPPFDRLTVDQTYDLVMWCVSLTEAQAVPGLAFGEDARRFVCAVWPFLAGYPLIHARDCTEGANDEGFYACAYLATHIGYVPTGYGRHRLYRDDAPGLYRYLRENFYAVLELGELDLVAEFVDLLRQLGCTESDDLQVRDGTRHLLRLYHASGDRWMAHREPYEEQRIDDYDQLHKAWTGIAGVRTRIAEPPSRGTYGGVFRAAFPHAPATRPATK